MLDRPLPAVTRNLSVYAARNSIETKMTNSAGVQKRQRHNEMLAHRLCRRIRSAGFTKIREESCCER